MKILCIDVGTGTQDILLFDSEQEIENSIQLVMPSPTQIVSRKVSRATAERRTLLIDGVTMGGGPGAWAVDDHVKAGLRVYATPDAARTFDDDLERVRELGVEVVPEDELARISSRLDSSEFAHVTFADVDLAAIRAALEGFYEPAQFDALAVAVFDHGAAPPGYSDRRFRFDYISRKLAEIGPVTLEMALTSFAAPRSLVDRDLTRLLSVARTIAASEYEALPLLLMDTGPAALLGALGDPVVFDASRSEALFVNVGNFHTLAFHIVAGRIDALFEHHTGLLDASSLVELLKKLRAGDLTNEEIFESSGHGALRLADSARQFADDGVLCAVTGPRRAMLAGPELPWPVYFAVPHGDMMLSGCYGLLRAFAVHFPQASESILSRLNPQIRNEEVITS